MTSPGSVTRYWPTSKAMQRAILAYAAVAFALLFGIDQFWPIWPVHMVAVLAALVVAVMTGLAIVAAGRR